jgi:hypothetical protein
MKQSETKRSLCILISLIFSSLILVSELIFRSLFRRSLTTSPLPKVLSLVREFNISLILMILDKRVRIIGANYSKLGFFVPSLKCPQRQKDPDATVRIFNCLSFGKGRGNQDCCDKGYNTHNFNTNEGCTYQGQNNQGFHFARISINSRDVFFKDRFMLAPVLICSKKFFEIESERFGDFLSLKTKPERNRIKLLSHQNVSIYLGFRGNKTELLRTISNFLLPVWNVFVCSKLLRNKTKLFLFKKNGIKTKPKRFNCARAS